MKLLRWAALPLLLALSSCSGQTAKTVEPSPVPSISLAPHKVSASSLVNGNRIQIDTTNPQLTHEECSALVDRYLKDAGEKGQIVVQKPGGEIWKGALLPFCVNNLDAKGTFFNDYYFSEKKPVQSPALSASPLATKPINVAMTVKVTAPSPKQVLVKGLTNLPTGFVLTISACRFALDLTKANGKTCLSHNKVNPLDQYVPVKNGKFEAAFTVPTPKELKTELIKYGQAINDPAITKEQPEQFVSVNIIGTPKRQTPEMLVLIGGEKALGLQGKHTKLFFDAFRTVEFTSQIKM